MTIAERRLYNLRRSVKAGDLKNAMYLLDWTAIVREAVVNRPTSFGLPNQSKITDWEGITEWRNATDEIMSSVIHHMTEAGLIKCFVCLGKGYNECNKIRAQCSMCRTEVIDPKLL